MDNNSDILNQHLQFAVQMALKFLLTYHATFLLSQKDCLTLKDMVSVVKKESCVELWVSYSIMTPSQGQQRISSVKTIPR
jgi:hypothetical protein